MAISAGYFEVLGNVNIENQRGKVHSSNLHSVSDLQHTN